MLEDEKLRVRIVLVVVFGLSFLPLFWPGAAWWLIPLGWYWLVIGGLWVDLFTGAWVWGWLLDYRLEGEGDLGE